MKIETNRIISHVEVQGQGDTALVFLHYWGGSSRTWRHVTELLSPRFKTVATDHRGWGRSSSGDGYGIEALAEDALSVINRLGLERFVLVGHSMGGKTAQLMASKRPAGLVGLVLVAPASPGPSLFPLEQRAMMSHAYDSRESVEATCLNVLTEKVLSRADLQQVIEDSLSGTAEAKLAWPMEAMTEDLSSEAAKIQVPVLIIGGECDKVDPIAVLKSQVLPLIPHAKMHVLKNTGHLSPLESPDELANHISRFAEGL